MYMYMYTCRRMSCIYSMSSAKVGSGCKTALAAAGPPVSAWSTPWYPITIWARMFASHASLPASSDMKPRGQWRSKGPWEKYAFLAGINHDFEPKRVYLYPPRGVTLGRGREWELPERPGIMGSHTPVLFCRRVLCRSVSACLSSDYHTTEGMVAEEKREKTNRFCFLFGTQSKARAGWPTRLRLVRATPSADLAVFTAQLWSTMPAIFSWVNNFAFNCHLRTRSWDYC